MAEAVRIVDPDERWPAAFTAAAATIRGACGPLALRIDHIGSTSVPHLPAKDVIDVQVTVADPSDLDRVAGALAAAGWRTGAADRDHVVPGLTTDPEAWRKRFLGEPPGERRVNVHVRVRGRPNQRYALLFRDYLRTHPAEATAYGAFKRRAATLIGDTGTYADLKDPVCDLVYLPAERWAADTGWTPETLDAGRPAAPG